MSFDMMNYKVGTCTEMCPRDEIKIRTANKLLDPLEKSLGVCIKAYSRSAAGAKEAKTYNLRTPETCLKTAKFLIEKIVLMKNLDLNVYSFVLDRLRSIRQDLIIQNVNSEATIQIYEICVKFLLYSGYELCESSDKNIFKFDPRQNYDQLRGCIKTLLSLYTELNIITLEYYAMVAVYLLIDVESLEPLLWLNRHHALNFKSNNHVSQAIRIHKACNERNFVAVFRHLPDLSILSLLAFQYNLKRIYRVLLEVMVVAYGVSSCQFPMRDFCRIFSLNPSEVIYLIKTHLNIPMEDAEVESIPFRKNTLISNPRVPSKKMSVVEKSFREFDKKSFFSLPT